MNHQQSDQYLWDQTGKPEPGVQELERAARASGFDASRGLDWTRANGARRFTPKVTTRLALVAASVLLATAAAFVYFSQRVSSDAWNVQVIDGTPRIADRRAEASDRLHPGQWLETDADSLATVEVGEIGTLTVNPDSRIRLVRSTDREHRIDLRRGRIEAFIAAPPRLFFVDTPHATAIDMGCAYNLEVADDGSGVLEVTLGLVELERAGRVCRIPRDVICRIMPGVGPGTPYRDAAPSELVQAIARVDESLKIGPVSRPQDLADVLSLASAKDSITLWHLLQASADDARVAVYERLAELCPPPAGSSRQAALALDAGELDRWWGPVSRTR